MTLGSLKADQPRLWRDALLGALGITAALAAALLPLPLAALLLLLPLPVALCFLEPIWAVYLLVLSVPIQEHWVLSNGLTATQFLAGLALFSWILRMLMRREARLPRPLLLIWVIHLVALMLAASVADYSVDQSIKELGRWVAAFLAFELSVTHVTSHRRAWGLVACLVAAGVATALLGLWQFATATGHESFRIGRFVRAYGPFGKPNPLAGYLNMAWPLALAVAGGRLAPLLRSLLRRDPAARPYPPLHYVVIVASAICAAILLAAEGATYSRGGWLGTAAGMLAMAALAWRRPGPRMLWSVILLSGLLLALLMGGSQYLPASIATRLESIVANVRLFDAGKASVNDENFAIVERMAHWQAGALMFLNHPLLGVGPGNFYLAYEDYYVGRWYVSQGHAHNYYIHIAAEAGIFGLLAYLTLITAVARQGLRAVTGAPTPELRALAIGCCGVIAAVAVHNIFENLHVLNMGIQLSAVWALLVWIAGQRPGQPGRHER